MPVMKQLRIGSVNYDTVGEAFVTQTLTSGTEIATVTIDGTSTKLYAPTPPTVPSASSTAPSMDGTAAAGTSADYARADHVHPTDTSRQATLVSGTNIKTINGTSILGGGNISTAELPTVTASDNGKVLGVVNGAWAKTASEATKSWYGTCSSGSMSSEKIIIISGFTSSDVVEGTLITVLFSYNSMYAGGINLELSGVDYGVYYNGSSTSTDNPLTWTQPNNVVTFIYHYPNWHYVSASSPIIPKASQSTLGGVKVGSGLSIDSDGVLSASGGGGGGGSVLTLYTNSNWSVLYADQARTQTFIDSCGWDIDAAVAAIQSADSVKVEYSSGSVSETCFMTSFYIDTLEDERRLCFRDRNAVDRAIDITWE